LEGGGYDLHGETFQTFTRREIKEKKMKIFRTFGKLTKIENEFLSNKNLVLKSNIYCSKNQILLDRKSGKRLWV
jgi:hypothetical protein